MIPGRSTNVVDNEVCCTFCRCRHPYIMHLLCMSIIRLRLEAAMFLRNPLKGLSRCGLLWLLCLGLMFISGLAFGLCCSFEGIEEANISASMGHLILGLAPSDDLRNSSDLMLRWLGLLPHGAKTARTTRRTLLRSKIAMAARIPRCSKPACTHACCRTSM